jgi:hypothetical protein|tara:strand:+ start:320 stop:772 length:453 start_codon:yes stop_codon:yes gene_type:complete
VALDRMKELCAGATGGQPISAESKTVTPKCRSSTSVGMVNGMPNPLNGDLGHLSPVEGRGLREVAISAEGKREPAERFGPQLAESILLEKQRNRILETKLEYQKKRNENLLEEVTLLKQKCLNIHKLVSQGRSNIENVFKEALSLIQDNY